MVEVVGTDEFEAWYLSLSDDEVRLVDRLVGLLEGSGFQLGHPYSSAVKGSKHAIRELRARSRSSPLRVFYAFDRFYERMLPLAERIWEQYVKEQHH